MRISVVCDRHVHAVCIEKNYLYKVKEACRDIMLVRACRGFCIVLKVKITKKTILLKCAEKLKPY